MKTFLLNSFADLASLSSNSIEFHNFRNKGSKAFIKFWNIKIRNERADFATWAAFSFLRLIEQNVNQCSDLSWVKTPEIKLEAWEIASMWSINEWLFWEKKRKFINDL